jgi:hypothetical protein
MLCRFIQAAVVAAALGGPALIATGAAACPDFNYSPHFGDISLSAGFQPDPYVMNVTAGGTQALQNCGFNATGFVTTRPDFRLFWNGTSSQLTIYVEAGADAVLLVNDPTGKDWFYSDDYRGTNPAITITNPLAGQYDIWIGSYDGSRRNPARLGFTEYNY